MSRSFSPVEEAVIRDTVIDWMLNKQDSKFMRPEGAALDRMKTGIILALRNEPQEFLREMQSKGFVGTWESILKFNMIDNDKAKYERDDVKLKSFVRRRMAEVTEEDIYGLGSVYRGIGTTKEELTAVLETRDGHGQFFHLVRMGLASGTVELVVLGGEAPPTSDVVNNNIGKTIEGVVKGSDVFVGNVKQTVQDAGDKVTEWATLAIAGGIVLLLLVRSV